MNEIKRTPWPWSVAELGDGDPYQVNAERGIVCDTATGTFACDESIANARLIAASPDMALALEMIAADADAGNSRLTSGVRLTLDAALIKAGRKAAPEKVRHFTTAGDAR
ncbi:MAG: hypothetical protein VB138_00280 [Burkholderia sp.]